MKKVLVAMSGGVDSAVTAYLLMQQGYSCTGATMLLCGNEDVSGAASVCGLLGIPFRVYDCREVFRDKVIAPFVRSYEEGKTPNPCIICNRHLKFGELYRLAMEEGFDFLATGHYARIEAESEGLRLKKALDAAKDQSYVLYDLTAEQLSHVLFPLGKYTKEQIRAIAAEIGFSNAKKGDSQDICFVPDGDHDGFIRRFTGKEYPAGEFVNLQGRVLGVHRGLIRYTVGQRKGLGLALPEPHYVCKKDVEGNRVILCTASELSVREITVDSFRFTGGSPKTDPFSATVRTRYHQKEHSATLFPASDGSLRVVFDSPIPMAAPGQSAVAYQGDTVIGGGEIR